MSTFSVHERDKTVFGPSSNIPSCDVRLFYVVTPYTNKAKDN